MPVKASMVIMSHLSDIQEISDQETRQKINFAKFLLLKYKNTDTEIDPNKEWSEFKSSPNA